MPWLELRSRASFGVLIEKQRARVAVHGKALFDANGMRTQNWPIPSDVGVERHSGFEPANIMNWWAVVVRSSLICSLEFCIFALYVAD